MKKQYIILGISIIALGISMIFDKSIAMSFYSIRFSILTMIMKIITNTWFIIIVLIIASIILYKKRRFLLLWASCLSALVITYVIKIIIMRTRPLAAPLINITGPSFPSMHAGLLFAVIPIINKYKPKLRYIWIILILLIAFSRIYLGVHYLSDIIAGALIGYALGLLIIWINEKYRFIK